MGILIFLGGAHTSICYFFHPSVCPSVRRAPYLRNGTSSDHNIWYSYVKWWYVQVWFFFSFFKILIFWAFRGVKGQKIAQKWKITNYICRAPYLSSIWSWSLVHFFKVMISPGGFYIFLFLISIFWAVREIKGEKRPKIKNNYICHASYIKNSIAYDHDFWYTCVKWWYLQVIFHFFKRDKRAKNSPKWQKILSVTLHSSGTIGSSFMVHMCKMIISPGIFSIFAKFWFFGLLVG